MRSISSLAGAAVLLLAACSSSTAAIPNSTTTAAPTTAAATTAATTAVTTASTTTSTTTTSTTIAETTTTANPSPHLRGVFTLLDASEVSGTWDDCIGTGGYDDFGPGMNVTVRDADGKIIGSGETVKLNVVDLSDPVLGPIAQPARTYGGRPISECIVKFDVEVTDADFYALKIGRRGELTYSRKDLAAKDWFVELSLGG